MRRRFCRAIPWSTRQGRAGLLVLPLQHDQPVLRIGPGDGRHVSVRRALQLQMIGAPIRGDDEIGLEVGRNRLDQDMHLLTFRRSAGRIADDPAHGIAG